MQNKKFIIVEEKDDKILLERLLQDFQVEIIEARGKPNIYDEGLKVLIEKTEFDEFRIKNTKENKKKLRTNIPKILVICDADNSYKKTRQKVKKAIKLAQEEYIFDVSIYVLPFNKNDESGGDLESFILEVLEDSKKQNLLDIKRCSEQFNRCTENNRIKQSESKFILHSMLLALTKHDNRKYGADYIFEIEETLFKEKRILKLKKSIEKFLN